MLTRILNILINYLYLFLLKITSKTKIIFSKPKIDSGFCVRLYGDSILEIKNLNARCNLKVHISNGKLKFGKNCFANNDCSFNCRYEIIIGDNTIFGEAVKVYDHDHLINNDNYISHQDFICKSVSIGSGCWIGSNVTILKGVTIADNVTIGANCVVSKSILKPGVYVNKSHVIKVR